MLFVMMLRAASMLMLNVLKPLLMSRNAKFGRKFEQWRNVSK